MKYLLDTDVLIYHIRGKEKIQTSVLQEGVAISIITYAELLYGSEKSQNPQKTRAAVEFVLQTLSIDVLPLEKDSVSRYAIIKSNLEKLGTPLDDFDLLIGATALRYGLTLITNNRKHFSRIPDLALHIEKASSLT